MLGITRILRLTGRTILVRSQLTFLTVGRHTRREKWPWFRLLILRGRLTRRTISLRIAQITFGLVWSVPTRETLLRLARLSGPLGFCRRAAARVRRRS